MPDSHLPRVDPLPTVIARIEEAMRTPAPGQYGFALVRVGDLRRLLTELERG